VRRFRDFHAHLDVPKAVLSDRLGGLVEHGILERRSDPDHASRYLYELTRSGRELWPVLRALVVWADHNSLPSSRLFRHAPCGTELDDAAHWRCAVRTGYSTRSTSTVEDPCPPGLRQAPSAAVGRSRVRESRTSHTVGGAD